MCILWSNRIIVPLQEWKQLLESLYDRHPGMVQMKCLSKNYFWWLNLNKDIKFKVRKCEPTI